MTKLPAFLLGLVFLATPAFAGDSPPASSKPAPSKKEAAPEGKGKPKAKAGEACKADTDCDRSGAPHRCVDSKCVAVPSPVHPVT